MRVLALVAAAGGLAACTSDFGVEDGEVLFVVVPTTQPESPDSGIFVELHVRPRDKARVKIGIERGTVSIDSGTHADALCIPSIPGGTAGRYALVVRPTDTEATLRATFVFDDAPAGGGACDGATGRSIVVAIRRPSENPMVDASVPDAAAIDAGSDADIDASPVDAADLPDAALAIDGGIDAQ